MVRGNGDTEFNTVSQGKYSRRDRDRRPSAATIAFCRNMALPCPHPTIDLA